MMSKMLLLGVFASVAVVAANDDGGRTWINGALSVVAELQTPVMKGWPDVKTAQFLDLPAFLEGIRTDVPIRLVRERSTFNWECTDGGSRSPNRACIAYLFVYSCHPCVAPDGGDFRAELIANDWERVPCRGQFSLAANPATGVTRRHDFHIFRKIVPVGEQVSAGPLKEDLEYAFLGLDKEGRMCSKQKTPDACAEADFANHCQWNADADVCEPTKCPRRKPPAGPFQPRCSYCVAQDEPFILS